MTETVLFYAGSALAIASGLGVVMARSPLRGALLLIVSLCGVALLFLLLEAPFVAAMQVLVYAGAIMVLFVFVIMLLNLGPDAHKRPWYISFSKLFGAAAAIYFAATIGWFALRVAGGAGKALNGAVKPIGVLLLSDYLFGFEAISVLLLVAVVGAVVLGLRKLG